MIQILSVALVLTWSGLLVAYTVGILLSNTCTKAS